MAKRIIVDLWRDFWILETGTGQQVAQLHERYTGCNMRNGPDFGRVFLMLNYTEKPQNTYIQSWTVWEIMAFENCGLPSGPRTIAVSWNSYLLVVCSRNCSRQACYVTTQRSSMMYSTSNREILQILTLQKPHIPASFNTNLTISKCVTAVKVSNFTGHFLPNRSTLDIGVLGFFGIV